MLKRYLTTTLFFLNNLNGAHVDPRNYNIKKVYAAASVGVSASIANPFTGVIATAGVASPFTGVIASAGKKK
jgi:hypothetical protein